MRQRVILKFGLTGTVVVAVWCLLNVMHQHSDDAVHEPPTQNDNSFGNPSEEIHEISEEENPRQTELEKYFLPYYQNVCFMIGLNISPFLRDRTQILKKLR
jgi:hypothetical protein